MELIPESAPDATRALTYRSPPTAGLPELPTAAPGHGACLLPVAAPHGRRRRGPRVGLVGADPLALRGVAAALTACGVDVASSPADVRREELVVEGAFDGVIWDDGPAGTGPVFDARGAPLLALVGDRERAREVLRGGARGALRRDGDGERMVAALVAIDAGLVVVDDAFVGDLVERGQSGAADDAWAWIEPLSGREREVIELVAEGLSNKEIAAALGISPHTAKFHVSTIMGKLDAQSRTEAAVRAARAGLL